MKIVIVTHRVVRTDGQGRVNYEIAAAAARDGHEVALVASEVDDRLADFRCIQWRRIDVSGVPSSLIRNRLFADLSTHHVRELRCQADIVLANGFITRAATDVNIAHFVHGAWKKAPTRRAALERGPYAAYQWTYTALNAFWEKRAFRQASVVVAVSDRVGKELAGIGIDAEKIHVIPNGVDIDQYAPGQVSRRTLNLPEGVPMAIFVGDIRTPRKNLDTVLRAMVTVPDLHLAVAGSLDGSPYPDEARQLGLEDRVHFLGFRKDVDRLMRASDLCVCPSRYEPFSLVLLEAMATGLPVVTARTVGASSLMDPSMGRIIDDPDDEEALAEALTEILSDDGLRRRMGDAARRKAQRHTWGRMAHQYLEIMEASLSSRRQVLALA